jgi:predicted type IV restriction endonuclease
MERAKERIRETLDEAKKYRERNPTSRISEADTKHNFIEPIISALGWRGIGVVTREYYIPSSQQYIDYVMSSEAGPLLAIEAKPFHSDLGEKEAAQLVMYCTVEGIEWAVLTNGRQLEFFNTFLKPDLAAKRVLRIDLLDYENDEDFEALAKVLWLLSRDSMTTSTGVRNWLIQVQLDRLIRKQLADVNSEAIKSLVISAKMAEIEIEPEDIVQWLDSRLLTPSAVIPQPRPQQAMPSRSQTKTPVNPPRAHEQLSRQTVNRVPTYVLSQSRPKARYRATLRDLIDARLVQAGERLVLMRGGMAAANATLATDGSIEWQGRHYATPSDIAFARLLGRQSLNGWTEWYVDRPNGRQSLASIRSEFLLRTTSQNDGQA